MVLWSAKPILRWARTVRDICTNSYVPSQEELARWYRFLPTGDSKEEQKIMDRIAVRFKKAGGMTPALSKKIGHGGV